jgi:hypothetical protein
MKEKEKILKEFINKILCIERELEELENSSYDFFPLYNGRLFSEQEKLAVNMENLALSLTHETATQIGFMRNDLEYLAKFIDFREKYSEFSDTELEEIMDKNLSLTLKKDFLKRFNTAESMIIRINELQQEWNTTFGNQDYIKLKKQLRI